MRTLKVIFSLLICTQAYGQENFSSRAYPSKGGEWRTRCFKVEEVALYGGGLLLGQATAEDSAKTASSVSGSAGLTFRTELVECDLYFSYNGKQEVNVSRIEDFGSVLMNPAIGGQSVSFSLRGNLLKKKVSANPNLLKASFQFSVSNQTWLVDSVTRYSASPLHMRIGVLVTPFNFSALTDKNDVEVMFRANYTHRSILGDFSNETRRIGDMTLVNQGYNGLDLAGLIKINSLLLTVQYSLNSNSIADKNVPGFSGHQILLGVSVTADAIKFQTNKSKKESSEPTSASLFNYSIMGKVTSATGDPLAGANLTLVGSDITTTTDSDGRFYFALLPPNSYTVKVMLSGYRHQNHSITVEDSSLTKLNITLDPE